MVDILKQRKKKFIDFCAGIGGGRLGLSLNGCECIGYSEIDSNPEKTYNIFYGYNEKNYGDLMKIDIDKLPEFDILIGGFPCQSFSIVGKRIGFEDYRGQVIYGICKILEEKNIPYFILENVKGLVNHDKGKTFRIIIQELEKLGYKVFYKILDSSDFGIPQMRERIYIVGLKQGFYKKDFRFPEAIPMKELKDFLIDEREENIFDINNLTFQKYLNNKYNKGKFSLEKILKQNFLILDTRQSDLRLYKEKCPTLRTGRHGILYVKNGKLKKLSGFESLLLQGFPKTLAQKVIDSKLLNNKVLSQAGNAMTVNVIQAIGKQLIECCL